MPQIKVKPLKWVDHGNGCLEALTTFGYLGGYMICAALNGTVEWSAPEATQFHEADSIESAKSACQAHWEAVVMNAIEVRS